ncbi:MAG: hypothetical protein IJ081_06755 [Prevotella sp.]|nr:hypothetical protein [Prevotella sp.]
MNDLQFCDHNILHSTCDVEREGAVQPSSIYSTSAVEGSNDIKRRKSVVVTFVWRDMTSKEHVNFRQGIKILGGHPFVVIHPHSYPVNYLKQKYPNITTLALDDKHFTGIEAYNQMMLSPWFYELFSDYEYMLIYQIDAYVFSDQLDYWTSMEYDYIGAPWMLNDNLYQNTLGHWLTRLLQHFPIRHNHVHSAHLFHHVGNGGFSLRRISKMRDIMKKNKNLIESAKRKHESQEDVMISIILGKKEQLRIPSWQLALYFSFEKAPARCLELTNGVFPFGCHDTNNRYWNSFWKYYIPQEEKLH